MNNFLTFLVNRHQDIIRYFFILLAVVIIALFFPKAGKFKYEFEMGKPWKYDNLIAPYNFGIHKTDDEMKAEKVSLLKDFKPYYRQDTLVYRDKKAAFVNNFNTHVKNLKKEKGHTKYDSLNYLNFGLQVIDQLYAKGIINLDDSNKDNVQTGQIIVLRQGNVAEKHLPTDYFNLEQAFNHMRQQVEERKKMDAEFIIPLLEEAIGYNIFFDGATTKKYQEELLDNISINRGMVQRGEMILQKGSIVTPEKFQVLTSYREEDGKRTIADRKSTIIFGGNLLLTLLVMTIFMFFVRAFSPEVFHNNTKFLFVLLLITMMIILISTLVKAEVTILYAIPFCIVPIMLRNFFGATLALHAHIALVLLSSFIVPFGIEYSFLQMIAGMVAIFTTIRAYYWSQFFLSNFYVLITYLLGYLAIAVMQGGSIDAINTTNFAYLGLNVLLTLLAYPLIPVFEKIFGFVSEITLMEYSDINRPLLKELSLRAPGTFNHSLSVANLAEAAAFEIGANSMLVKVGALYHDIGKIQNPLYFIENQHSGINPHDDLPYDESARIIVNHVKHGIEIARKHKVPDILIDFIRTHHGTTRVEFFFQSFLKSHPGQLVDEDAFRYPGPKPYSKETAVLMMADSCEAASRSLKNPTNDDIDHLVETLVNSKIDQNQFSNCDITFKDITIVKKTLKKMLGSMYHVRIAYPEDKK